MICSRPLAQGIRIAPPSAPIVATTARPQAPNLNAARAIPSTRTMISTRFSRPSAVAPPSRCIDPRTTSHPHEFGIQCLPATVHDHASARGRCPDDRMSRPSRVPHNTFGSARPSTRMTPSSTPHSPTKVQARREGCVFSSLTPTKERVGVGHGIVTAPFIGSLVPSSTNGRRARSYLVVRLPPATLSPGHSSGREHAVPWDSYQSQAAIFG
jgi:hypothetical protein